MKDIDGFASLRATALRANTRRQRPACRVGNVFILNKETNGAFKQIIPGWGWHFVLVAGGLSSVCVLLESPQAAAKEGVELRASTELKALSNKALQNGKIPDTWQRQERGCRVASRNSYLEAPQLVDNQEYCSPRSDSESCSEVSVNASRETKPGAAAHLLYSEGGTFLEACSGPQTADETRCKVKSRRTLPAQTILYLEDDGTQYSSEICFNRSPESCSRVPPHAGHTDSNRICTYSPPRFVQISVGSAHTLVCDCAGTLYSLKDTHVVRGRRRQCDLRPILALQNQRVVTACAGDHYSLAITDTGEVYSWGAAYSGQLGRAAEEVAIAPRFVASLMRIFITGVSCNESHVIAHSQDGECFGWGSNDCGQLGLGIRCPPQAHPQRIHFRMNVARQSRDAGGLSTRRTVSEGRRMLCTRSAERGRQVQLSFAQCFLQERRCQSSTAARDRGYCVEHCKADVDDRFARDENSCDELRETPTFVVAVAAGWRHSLALTASGDVYSWGFNIAGQLGLGHFRSCYAPTRIQDYESAVQAVRYCGNSRSGGNLGGWPGCAYAPEALIKRGSDDNSGGHLENTTSTIDALTQIGACQKRNVTHGEHREKSHMEELAHNGFAESFGVFSGDWGGANSQMSFAVEACNGSYAARIKHSETGDERPSLTGTGGSSRPAQRSATRGNENRGHGARSAALCEAAWRREESNYQEPRVLDNREDELKTQVAISQVCAGQLFSAFLSSDGRVFLAGQTPNAKQAAACAQLLDRIQCEYGQDTRCTSGNLTPDSRNCCCVCDSGHSYSAPVPGLEGVTVTGIAGSNKALVAFVPCQVLRVQPSLVPLPSPGGPPINLRLSITVFPHTSSSTREDHEANRTCEEAMSHECHIADKEEVAPADREDGLLGTDCACYCPESHYSSVVSGGHEAEPCAHQRRAKEDEVGEGRTSPMKTEENTTEFAPSALHLNALANQSSVHSGRPLSGIFEAPTDSEGSNKKRMVQKCLAHDVLVRFRSLASGPSSVFKTPLTATVVKGRFLRRLADEVMPAAEIHCTCPTLLHGSSGNAFAVEKNCSGAPRDTMNASSRRSNARVPPRWKDRGFSPESPPAEPELVCGKESQDTSLPDASYFQPETLREEEFVRAYHETKCFLNSQPAQVLPYALEVSVDGGCCWSNADLNKAAASVLFARFPEAVLAVCPNNVTVKGGLTLSILLDYIPSGIPEENIVVKFTCIHKYHGAVFPNRCLPHPKDHYSSPTPSSHTPGAAFSEQSPFHNKRDDEKAKSTVSERYSTGQRSDGAQPFAVRSQVETGGGAGRKTGVGQNGDSESSFQSSKGCQQITEGSVESAAVGSAPQTIPGDSAAITCTAEDEGQDLSYFVLVPARIAKIKSKKESFHLATPQEVALQCSSPAFDGSKHVKHFDVFVDIALNGVNFTGRPLPLRVLEAEILELFPDVGYSRRETKVYIRASEHCHSSETAVLLKYDDGYQQVVPCCMEPEAELVYFIMPERRSLPTSPAEHVLSILESKVGSTEKGNFFGGPLGERRTTATCKSDAAPGLSAKCSPTRDAVENANHNVAELPCSPVSVHLSFNGQVFSHSGKTFLHYDSEPVVVGMLAYTVSEGGELFEADLENVIMPGTTLVISLQSAVVTQSAQVRLTVLKSEFACSFPPFPPPASASVGEMDAYALQQEGNVAPPPEAVERVVLLPAALDMEPHRIVLQSDHGRIKKKHPGSRGALPDSGGKGKPLTGPVAGTSGTGNTGATIASKKNAGGAPNPGGGGAPVENSSASSRLKNKAAGGSSGGPSIAAVGGAFSSVAAPGNKTSTKKHEKASDLNTHVDAEDDKSSGPTLTVTIPPITVDSQQADTSATDGVLFALGEISLDGQHFVHLKHCSVLRLQCSRAHTEAASASRPASPSTARFSQGKTA